MKKWFYRVLDSMRDAWKAVCTSASNLRREYIVEQYLRAGTRYGNGLSRLFTGECVDLQSARQHWAHLERQYAAFGYRTVPTDEFVEYAHGKVIDYLLRVSREPTETPVLYAEAAAMFDQFGFAPLLDFDSEHREWPNCAVANDSEGDVLDGDCDLIGCRRQQEKHKQERSGQWRF